MASDPQENLCFHFLVGFQLVCSTSSLLPLFDGRRKQQLATTPAPCGLIKLRRRLLSVSLIRPPAWTSESVLVYGYGARGPQSGPGSRKADDTPSSAAVAAVGEMKSSSGVDTSLGNLINGTDGVCLTELRRRHTSEV